MIKQMQADIAALKVAVAAMSNVTIEGYDKTQSRGGTAFGRGTRHLNPIILPDRFVVVTKDPVDGDATLKVREVRYIEAYPQPCAGNPSVCYYEWYGEEFDAFPIPGESVTKYADQYQSAAEPLTVDTPVSECVRNHNAWIVKLKPEGGGGGLIPAVVVSAETGETQIRVQPMKRIIPPPPSNASQWTTDGDPITVPIWGDQRGEDFVTLVDVPTATIKHMIPLIVVNGEKYAMQYFWFYAKTPLAGIPRGDCQL